MPHRHTLAVETELLFNSVLDAYRISQDFLRQLPSCPLRSRIQLQQLQPFVPLIFPAYYPKRTFGYGLLTQKSRRIPKFSCKKNLKIKLYCALTRIDVNIEVLCANNGVLIVIKAFYYKLDVPVNFVPPDSQLIGRLIISFNVIFLLFFGELII